MTQHPWPTNDRNWRPALVESRTYGGGQPAVGTLIGHRGRVLRVLAIDPIDPLNLSDEERDYVERNKREPYRVRVQDPAGGKPFGLRVVGYWNWYVVPEHYAVCAVCHDPAPCRGHALGVYAAEEAARVERDLAVLPGCCPSCTEPITQRQRVIEYSGPNLLNPLAEPGVRFHARLSCRSSAASYERKWIAADPTRRPSLLTLSCAGSVTVHGDGTGECHGDPDCPSVYARHRRYVACYAEPLGCGRECPVAGHPGTRLAGFPDDVWAW